MSKKNGKKTDEPESLKGHNGAGERVNSFVQRIERLESERADLAIDVAAVLKEAENAGFDKKIIKTIVKIRKDKAQFEKDLSLVETYMREMGDQLNFEFGAPYESSALEDMSEAA